MSILIMINNFVPKMGDIVTIPNPAISVNIRPIFKISNASVNL